MPVLRQPPGGWGLGAGRDGGAGGPSMRADRRARRWTTAALWLALPLHLAGAWSAGAPTWVALVGWVGLAAASAVLETLGGRARTAPVFVMACLSAPLWQAAARGDAAVAGALLCAQTSLLCLAVVAGNPRAANLVWPAGVLAAGVACWAPGGLLTAAGIAASGWAPMRSVGRRRSASAGWRLPIAFSVPLALAAIYGPTRAASAEPVGWAIGLGAAVTGFASVWAAAAAVAVLLIGLAGCALETRWAAVPPVVGAGIAAAVTGSPAAWLPVLPLLLWVIYDVPAEWAERLAASLSGPAGRLVGCVPLLLPATAITANAWAIILAWRRP